MPFRTPSPPVGIRVSNNGNGGSTVVGDNNEGNNGVFINGNNNVISNTSSTDRMPADKLKELEKWSHTRHISLDALHNSKKSPPKCHSGTRGTVLGQVEQWINDTTASPILWLHGPAGVGKSVADNVVATFFFSTSSDKSAEPLVPTLAWQLAHRFPEARRCFLDTLKNEPHILESEMEAQFSTLVIEPLEKVKAAQPERTFVMIVDGVDECTDNGMTHRFLELLEHFTSGSNAFLRFLISSRPEPIICAAFDKISRRKRVADTSASSRPASTTLPDRSADLNTQSEQTLGSRLKKWITQYVSDLKSHLGSLKNWRLLHLIRLWEEVRKLYQPLQYKNIKTHVAPLSEDLDEIHPHHLASRIGIGHSDMSTMGIERYLHDTLKGKGEGWKSSFKPDDVHRLAEICCGQFLYATVVRNVVNGDELTPNQLFNLSSQTPTEPLTPIDNLYKAILHRQTEPECLRDILSMPVVFSQNVHFASVDRNFPIIEGILGLPQGTLITKLSKMHSLLKVVQDESVDVYHRSFLEFLQNDCRSKPYHVSYEDALRRFLVLLRHTARRYRLKSFWGQLSNDDRKNLECIRNMFITFPMNFFRRSRNPTIVGSLHALAQGILIALVWAPLHRYAHPLWAPVVHSLSPSLLLTFLIELCLPMILFLVLAHFFLMLSLVYYLSKWNDAIIHPFFHPFFSPYLAMYVKLLLP